MGLPYPSSADLMLQAAMERPEAVRRSNSCRVEHKKFRGQERRAALPTPWRRQVHMTHYRIVTINYDGKLSRHRGFVCNNDVHEVATDIAR